MTKRELEAEVQRLSGEVAALKVQQAAHVCPQPVWPNPMWPYGGVYVGDVPPFQGWINTCAAAPAPLTTTFMVNTAAAQPASCYAPTVCGGAAGVPQILTFNIPARR